MFSAIQRKEIDKFLSMLYDLAIKEYGIMSYHWETGKGQQVGENSESEYRQLCTIVTESGGINGGFIFLSRFEDFR